MESQLEALNTFIQKEESLSPFFCTLTESLQTFPRPDASTQEKVASLFKDLNKQIELYDRQFEVLQQELGVLCPQTQSPIPTQFFEGLLALFRLAYGTYKEYPEVTNFEGPLETIVNLLQTGKMSLPEKPLEQALLLQLIKSAWALTKSSKSQEFVANQLKKQGGNRRTNRTRKQKH